jgi:hypothetical protein
MRAAKREKTGEHLTDLSDTRPSKRIAAGLGRDLLKEALASEEKPLSLVDYSEDEEDDAGSGDSDPHFHLGASDYSSSSTVHQNVISSLVRQC